MEMELRNEETYERALLCILEIDLAGLQEDDILLEERMESLEEFQASFVCINLVELCGTWLELCLIREDEIIDLLPFVRMLIELVYVVAFAFIDDAENNHSVGKVLGLVRIFDDDGVDLCFLFYGNALLSLNVLPLPKIPSAMVISSIGSP